MSSSAKHKIEKSNHSTQNDAKSDRRSEHEHRKKSRKTEKESRGKRERSEHRDVEKRKRKLDEFHNQSSERFYDGRKMKSQARDDHYRKPNSEKPFDSEHSDRKEKRHKNDGSLRKKTKTERSHGTDRKMRLESTKASEDKTKSEKLTEQNERNRSKPEQGLKVDDASHMTAKNEKLDKEITVSPLDRKRKSSTDKSTSKDKDEELRLKRIKIRETCDVQLLDKRFFVHLSEMHPTSALHELCSKLNWPPPNMNIAFECGPPMARMYIFKAIVNCQIYQPAVAVDNKKDAKSNAAWFALQELGFVKKDAANPL